MSGILTSLPWWAWPAIALGLLAAVVTGTNRLRAGFSLQTDPQRGFDGDQRAEGRRRCGNRCEHKSPLWFRCDGNADQADHVYPWSGGGATSLSNLQYLCSQHNRAKSKRVPSWCYIWRLERRRRGYFPTDVPVQIAWRFGEAPARRT